MRFSLVPEGRSLRIRRRAAAALAAAAGLAPAAAPAADLVLHPTQDARVKSTSPASSYGADPELRTRTGSDGIHYRSYLQFEVTGLSAPPRSARLRLFNTDGSKDGGSLYPVAATFDERTLSWANAPACGGTALARVGSVATGAWVELELGGAIAGNGVYAFCLASASSDSALYSSKEGAKPPELVLTPAPTAACSSDAACDDGFFCNGAETCDPALGCRPAATAPCASGACDEAFDACTEPARPPAAAEQRSGTSTQASVVITSADLAAVPGALYLAAVSTKPHVEVSQVSGLGLAWAPVAAQCGGRSQTGVSLWSAQGVPSAAGPVIATLARAASAAVLTATRYADAAPNGIGTVASANTLGPLGACAGGADATSWMATLDVAGDGAAAYAAVALRQRTHTPTGFEERSELRAGSGGNVAGLAVGEALDRSAGTQLLGGTFNGLVDWAAVVAEILPAPSRPPYELPPVPVPAENPLSESKRVLGKILFWDEQLSTDDSMACGTCHQPLAGGADPRLATHPGADALFGTADDVRGSAGVVRRDASGAPVADPLFGFAPQVTRRSAPTVFGAAFAPELFVDGAARGAFVDPQSGRTSVASGGALESQAVRPPVDTVEMSHPGRDWSAIAAKLAQVPPLARAGGLPADVAAALAARPTYPLLFAAAFGDTAISAERIAFAIASYERTLVPDQTPWDRFMRGDLSALTARQQEGWEAFRTSLCASCHLPPLFTDQKFHNIGVRPPAEDPGRQRVTGLADDRGKFRTPTLRNAGLKQHFMHDGRISSVNEAVAFYLDNRSLQFTENRDPLMPRVDIPPDLELSVVDFIRNGLVDPRARDQAFPFDRPTLSGGTAP